MHHPESQEFAVWKLLSTPPLLSDPRNHTVPVRDVLFFAPDFSVAGYHEESSDERVFIVMDEHETLDEPHNSYGSAKPTTPYLQTAEATLDFSHQLAEVRTLFPLTARI